MTLACVFGNVLVEYVTFLLDFFHVLWWLGWKFVLLLDLASFPNIILSLGWGKKGKVSFHNSMKNYCDVLVEILYYSYLLGA